MTSTMSTLIVSFPGSIAATLDRVGGKGQSLIRMTQLGLPVPPGIVLTVEFFDDWVDELKLSDEWNEFAKSTAENLKTACDRLKERALKLTLSPKNREILSEAIKGLDGKRLMAVRSSSPSEDLEGTSFAGGYDTILGVTKDSLEDAIRKAFSSCLDFRVVTYKLHHGFAIDDPRIAVVVQEQIDSTVSGVAFSINPINNDFDEAVFNANWGLGETVVSGVCTPDTIVVNKHTMRVVDKILGLKETSITLQEGGGTTEAQSEKSKEFSISDGHVLSLTRYVKTLEEVFRTPIDVEWALEKDREYILQARPVTTYVPLAESLQTKPGERRKIYLDATLCVQAMEKPLSRMQISIFNHLGKVVGRKLTGSSLINESGRSFVLATEGRLYLVLSHFLQIYGAKLVSKFIENVDPITAKTIMEADEKKYKSHELWVSMAILRALPGYLKKAPGVLNARMFPSKAHEQTQEKIERFKSQIRRISQSRAPVHVVANRALECAINTLLEATFPVFIASRIALERIKQTVKGAPEELVRNLELALPYNVTVEMGMSLYRISQALTDKDLANPPNYDQPIEPQLSPEVALLWKDFLDNYGHRGPGELDIAAPRYREEPQMLYEQVLALKRASKDGVNPLTRYEKNLALRDEAYEKICQLLESEDTNRLRRFQSLYRVWSTLGGYRETHKYLLIFALDAIRTRLLREADELVSKGRLDKREQVFDLSLTDLATNLRDRSANLVEIGQNNRKFTDRLARVSQLPALIDSRGRILRKKPEQAKEGEITGTAVSQGQVRGRVKVLHSPDEKPFLHGEILVARATDPGWTPLFVNAAAVILEVGGMLQHGALVAREYGLPCVSGITDATTIFQDGMMVEVDGSNGIVRPLTPVEQGSAV